MHQKLNLYTSYYILVILHYMQYIYAACCTYITSHCTETFKICLSDRQDLHVKMKWVNIAYLKWSYMGFITHLKPMFIGNIYNNKNFWQKFSISNDYKTNSWILEKPGNSWRILENIWTSKTGFIPDFLFIPNFILNSRILPSEPRPTILWSYLTCYI